MVDMSYLELQKMVEFFYSAYYEDDISKEIEQGTGRHVSPLQLHARMFALGDRYDVSGLRDLAGKKYYFGSAGSTKSRSRLKLLESIHDVYAGTPDSIRPLRDIACLLVRKNLPMMLNDKTVATTYDKLIAEIPDFAKDLLGIYVNVSVYKHCPACLSDQAMELLEIRCKGCGKKLFSNS